MCIVDGHVRDVELTSPRSGTRVPRTPARALCGVRGTGSSVSAGVAGDEQVHCRAIEWDRGRVVLIGDAAHASSPMMGQGGCMAIEDALVLVELLSAPESVEKAFDAYVLRRRPRVDWVQRQSRAVGESLVLPPSVRDAELRKQGERMFQERYAPLLAPP